MKRAVSLQDMSLEGVVCTTKTLLKIRSRPGIPEICACVVAIIGITWEPKVTYSL